MMCREHNQCERAIESCCFGSTPVLALVLVLDLCTARSLVISLHHKRRIIIFHLCRVRVLILYNVVSSCTAATDSQSHAMAACFEEQ